MLQEQRCNSGGNWSRILVKEKTPPPPHTHTHNSICKGYLLTKHGLCNTLWGSIPILNRPFLSSLPKVWCWKWIKIKKGVWSFYVIKVLMRKLGMKSENWNIVIRLRPCSNFLRCVWRPLLAYRITGQETFRPAEKQNAKKLPKHWKKTMARSAMQCWALQYIQIRYIGFNN